MTEIFRWRVYMALLIGEFLALAVPVLFMICLLDLGLLGGAYFTVSPAWFILARSKPFLFFIVASASVCLFLILELLRRWLKRTWMTDIWIGENL